MNDELADSATLISDLGVGGGRGSRRKVKVIFLLGKVGGWGGGEGRGVSAALWDSKQEVAKVVLCYPIRGNENDGVFFPLLCKRTVIRLETSIYALLGSHVNTPRHTPLGDLPSAI